MASYWRDLLESKLIEHEKSAEGVLIGDGARDFAEYRFNCGILYGLKRAREEADAVERELTGRPEEQ